jgi:hypothetical protein
MRMAAKIAFIEMKVMNLLANWGMMPFGNHLINIIIRSSLLEKMKQNYTKIINNSIDDN